MCPGFAVRGTFAAHLAKVPRRGDLRPAGPVAGAAAGVPDRGRRRRPPTRPPRSRSFLRLHRLRWAAEGGSAGIPPGPVEAFHREVAPLLAARGWLRLYVLHAGGAAIAAVYGIEVGRRFYYYQSGYDPAWAPRSPGLVLVGRTVEDAYARGLTDYDFLRGSEPYKLEWACGPPRDPARSGSTRRRCAPAPTPLARGAWRGARGAARAVDAPRAPGRRCAASAGTSRTARWREPARRRGDAMPDRSDLSRLAREGAGGAEPSPLERLRRAAKAAAAGALLASRRATASCARSAPGRRAAPACSCSPTTARSSTGRRGPATRSPRCSSPPRRCGAHLEQLGRSLGDRLALRGGADPRRGAPRPPSRRDFAAVTFDDGYADNHAVALPVLEALRVPATIYVATGFTGTDAALRRTTGSSRRSASSPRRGIPPGGGRARRAGPGVPRPRAAGASPAETLDRLIALVRRHAAARRGGGGARGADRPDPEEDLPAGARPIDWDEVRDLEAAGVDVGGHTVRHAALPNLLARRGAPGDRGLPGRHRGAARAPPRHFAYPNGYHSPGDPAARCARPGSRPALTTEDEENVHGCDPLRAAAEGALGELDARAARLQRGARRLQLRRGLRGPQGAADRRRGAADPPAVADAADDGHRAAS